MFEKLEELQNKSKSEKSKIFWTTLLFVLPVTFLLGLGLASFSVSNSSQSLPALGGNYLDDLKKTLDSSRDLISGTQNVIDNAKNIAGTLVSPVATSTDVNSNYQNGFSQQLPSSQSQPSNNVYFLPSPNQ